MKRTFGWIPDIPDQRDKSFAQVMSRRKLPTRADLRALCTAVEDQRELGSCTGNATAGGIEFAEAASPKIDVSRLFLYYNGREDKGNDTGAMIRNVVKGAVKLGVCFESSWPYDIARFAEQPPAACYEEAAGHKVTSYYRIDSLYGFRASIADGFPVIFGFAVYESFLSDRVAKTGKMPMPKLWERFQGGHAVLGVGYDDKARVAIVRNSWGDRWGMKGYFTMPYAYLESRNLSDDFWTIRKANL